MQKFSFITILTIAFLLFGQLAKAEIKLPAIVSSNMVLQRNTTVVIWGWSDANEKITLKASWLIEPLMFIADIEGNWRVEVKTTNNKGRQSISIQSRDSDILLENILFGEVWLCSGQSNMYQPVKGYNGQPTFGTLSAVVSAPNPNLRLFTVDRMGSKTPKNDVEKYTSWQQASSDNIADFSAVAYYFGQQLEKTLNVPVGMIHTSWGGSKVEAWISKEVISNYQEVNLDSVDIKGVERRLPTLLYNAMINPLIPFSIKGALWYQGEANRDEPEKYKKLFPAMVQDWRSRWGIGNFPFYFVQIAPYWYNNNDAFATTRNSAFMREAQEQCVDLIPNSGIAITTDIGEKFFIHPPKKKEVADRLLYNALHQTYGFKGVDGKSPVYESLEIKNSEILLTFENAENGLYAYDDLTGFEIAGEDKVFYPAIAKVVGGKKVSVKSEKVLSPLAVRYAWRNWIKGTLYDTNLLPASSFRTDDWDDAIRCTDGTTETAFDALNTGIKWDLNFEDECTGDWMQNWTLDGLKASVDNSDRGMHFRAGPEFKDDAHHAVMWTKQSFEGNVKIEYDYTRTDSETRCVNILYIQATGKDKAPYVNDISKWSELREVPAMRTYYENMNALHISYAAFPNTSDTNSYVRARRYPKTEKVSFKQTEIPPSYDNDDFFKPGETYHITVIKTRTQLFFKVEGKDGLKLFSWNLSKLNPITEGRIGLRHMYTRSSIYHNFNIYTNSN